MPKVPVTCEECGDPINDPNGREHIMTPGGQWLDVCPDCAELINDDWRVDKVRTELECCDEEDD